MEDSKNQEYVDEDEFNLSLAAMEQEIKPQIILTVNTLCKYYTKLIKTQKENDEFKCVNNILFCDCEDKTLKTY